MKEGEVVARGLLEPRGNGSEALKGVEEHLDAVALGVALSVEARLLLPCRICVDDRLDLQRLQLSADGIRVVAGVAYARFAARVVRDDLFGDRGLMLLPRRDLDVDGAALRVDEGVDFG